MADFSSSVVHLRDEFLHPLRVGRRVPGCLTLGAATEDAMVIVEAVTFRQRQPIGDGISGPRVDRIAIGRGLLPRWQVAFEIDDARHSDFLLTAAAQEGWHIMVRAATTLLPASRRHEHAAGSPELEAVWNFRLGPVVTCRRRGTPPLGWPAPLPKPIQRSTTHLNTAIR
jgi:hypothetical protein